MPCSILQLSRSHRYGREPPCPLILLGLSATALCIREHAFWIDLLLKSIEECASGGGSQRFWVSNCGTPRPYVPSRSEVREETTN